MKMFVSSWRKNSACTFFLYSRHTARQRWDRTSSCVSFNLTVTWQPNSQKHHPICFMCLTFYRGKKCSHENFFENVCLIYKLIVSLVAGWRFPTLGLTSGGIGRHYNSLRHSLVTTVVKYRPFLMFCTPVPGTKWVLNSVSVSVEFLSLAHPLVRSLSVFILVCF